MKMLGGGAQKCWVCGSGGLWKIGKVNGEGVKSVYSLIHEPRKRQVPKLSRANCLTLQLAVRA